MTQTAFRELPADTKPEPEILAATDAIASSYLAGPGHLASPGWAQAGEYLSFRLGDENYGIAILDVKEIRSFEEPTRIADAPSAVLGVVNLRGLIVPIIDLRHVFGCTKADVGELTVVIVLALQDRTIGVVVDAVSDVVDVPADQLQPPPDIICGGTTASRAMTGLACLPPRSETAQRMLVLVRAEALAEAARTH